jgi:hypothetical protein
MPDKKGYSFDGCSPMLLMKNASVKDGKIVFPGGGSYSIMVLPQVETMTPELLAKIKSLINDGACVMGNPPLKSPSLVNYPECDNQVRMISDEIWGEGSMPGKIEQRNHGTGKIWWGEDILKKKNTSYTAKDSLNIYPDYNVTASILKGSGVNQDFSSTGSIRYNHRSHTGRDIYFISNRTDSRVYDTCFFRDGSLNAELWDPLTGEIYHPLKISNKNDSYLLSIEMEPYQSYFVVFNHNKKGKDKNPVLLSKISEQKVLMNLEGPWNVSFDTAWGGPEKTVFEDLTDWSDNSVDGIRFYSGSAKYYKSFSLPENIETGNSRYFLDLGIVKNIARIKVNGVDKGVVWTAPWQTDITELLKKEDNTLEIEVANLWINRLIGDENEPWDGIKDGKWPEWLINGSERKSSRFTFTTHRFYKKDDPLYESGLLGPVTIKTIQK